MSILSFLVTPSTTCGCFRRTCSKNRHALLKPKFFFTFLGQNFINCWQYLSSTWQYVVHLGMYFWFVCMALMDIAVTYCQQWMAMPTAAHNISCHGMLSYAIMWHVRLWVSCHDEAWASACQAMACHVMAWYAMACHTMTWYAVPWHAVPWHAVPWHVMLWHSMTWYAVPWHAVPWHAVP